MKIAFMRELLDHAVYERLVDASDVPRLWWESRDHRCVDASWLGDEIAAEMGPLTEAQLRALIEKKKTIHMEWTR